jgi:hypothetical protein
MEHTSEEWSSRHSDAESLPEIVSKKIVEQPFIALAIAAGMGFLVGGGLRTKAGWGLMLLGGRLAAREMVSNYVAGALSNGGRRRNIPD